MCRTTGLLLVFNSACMVGKGSVGRAEAEALPAASWVLTVIGMVGLDSNSEGAGNSGTV